MKVASFGLTMVALLGTGLGAAAAQAAAALPGLSEPIEIHKGLSDKEWPQLGNTPQRTGYSPVKIAPPFEEKWRVCLSDFEVGNNILRTVQPIVAEGKVYLGCKNGRLFALDARSGAVEWTYVAGGAICHTAAYAEGKVFAPAMDGCVYALGAGSGAEVWRFSNGRRYGFSTAVLLAEDRVLAVDRGGRLFCINPADGEEVWHYDAAAPVDQSPAYDDGTVFFADEHMRVHAVEAATGKRVWVSKKLPGLTFHQFWPVVVCGAVIVRPYNGAASDVAWSSDRYRRYRDRAGWKDPVTQTLVLLDEKTGEEWPAVEHYDIGMMSGPPPPPAVTRDGLLVSRWTGGYLDPKDKHVPGGGQLTSSPWNGHIWALQDIRNQGEVITLLEPDYVGHAVGRDELGKVIAVGIGPPDETTVNSVLGDLVTSIISMGWRNYGEGGKGLLRTHYSRAHGIYSLEGQRWHWEGISEASMWANTFSGGVSAVSGADGRFYNVSYNWVQCHGSANEE